VIPTPSEKSELAHRLAVATMTSGGIARCRRENGLDSHNLYYGTKWLDLGAGAEFSLSSSSHLRLALSDVV
jgi:hypothetical protein